MAEAEIYVKTLKTVKQLARLKIWKVKQLRLNKPVKSFLFKKITTIK